MHVLLTAELDYEKAKQQLTLTSEEKRVAKLNTSVFAGDYWQDGEGYIGPRPTQGQQGYEQVTLNIKKLFRSEGIYKEIIGRQVNALFSRPAVISFERQGQPKKQPGQPDPANPDDDPKPPQPPPPDPNADPSKDKIKQPVPPSQQTAKQTNPDGTVREEPADPLVEEITAAFSDWLNSKDVRLAMMRVLERRLLTEHGAWRYFIPPRVALVENNKKKDILRLLQDLGIDEPVLDNCRVVKDPQDNSYSSFTLFGTDSPDVHQVNNATKQSKIEVGFTDDAGRTYIGILLPGTGDETGQKSADALVNSLAGDGIQKGLNKASLRNQGLDQAGTSAAAQGGAEPLDATEGIDGSDGLPAFNARSQPLELHGNLLTYEMRGATLCTEQVWQNTKALSLSLTMTNHVSVEAGHSEMALTNVAIETVEVSDITSSTGRREVPARPIERGQSAVNNFVGIEQVHPDGSVTNANPQVLWKEPSPVTTQVDGYTLAKRAILDEVHQLHAMIADKATATGESRIQALADFVEATTRLQVEVNHFGTWIVETALWLCANLLGRPELLEIRGRYEAQITAGRLSGDEQSQVLAQIEKKVRSKRSARSLLGIYDSESEDLQIRREAQDEMTMPNSMSNPANPMSPLNPEQIKRQEQLAKDAGKNLPPGKGSPPPSQP